MRKVKYGKTVAVVCLTVLVWVWADLAMDVELTVHSATIGVIKSNPKIWASLDRDSFEMVLKGPAPRIVEVKKKLREGPGLEFYLDVAQERMDEPGSYPLNLLAFLQRDKEIKQLGLKVDSCKPDKVFVKVVGLVERPLEVRCVDGDRNLVTATVDPTHVKMYVAEDWEETAEVQLSDEEINQARVSAIGKVPCVRLPTGQTKKADTAVKITMPPKTVLLKEETIRAPILGFALSGNLQGIYKVEVANLPMVMSRILIKATPEAKREYENMRYHVILEIYESDAESTEPLKRMLFYNFPHKSVQEKEIELNQQPVEARFRLIELTAASSAETTSGGVE